VWQDGFSAWGFFMAVASPVWNLVQQLSEAYDQTGLTVDERTQTLLTAFRELPPTVRRQLLADVFRLSMDLPDLYASMVAIANSREQRQEDSKFWTKGNTA
jgi:hypothetical protein